MTECYTKLKLLKETFLKLYFENELLNVEDNMERSHYILPKMFCWFVSLTIILLWDFSSNVCHVSNERKRTVLKICFNCNKKFIFASFISEVSKKWIFQCSRLLEEIMKVLKEKEIIFLIEQNMKNCFWFCNSVKNTQGPLGRRYPLLD